MLTEEFLKPLGLTEYRLAKDIAVPPRRIHEIVHGKRAISTDTAFRLSQYFGNSPQFWLNSRPITNCAAWNAPASCRRSGAAHCSPQPEPESQSPAAPGGAGLLESKASARRSTDLQSVRPAELRFR